MVSFILFEMWRRASRGSKKETADRAEPQISGRMMEVAGSQLNPYLTMNFFKLLKTCGDQIIADGLELSAEAPLLSEEELSRRCVCE